MDSAGKGPTHTEERKLSFRILLTRYWFAVNTHTPLPTHLPAELTRTGPPHTILLFATFSTRSQGVTITQRPAHIEDVIMTASAFDLDRMFMQIALREAQTAYEEGEVPVGAVVVCAGELIGKAHNQRETLQDPTAHAEVLAITQAAAALQSWRLEGCTLYVTLEPCAMCAGAIVLARLDRVIYGADDLKAGACGSVLDVLGCERLNHTVELTTGLLADECGQILRDFFRERRKR